MKHERLAEHLMSAILLLQKIRERNELQNKEINLYLEALLKELQEENKKEKKKKLKEAEVKDGSSSDLEKKAEEIGEMIQDVMSKVYTVGGSGASEGGGGGGGMIGSEPRDDDGMVYIHGAVGGVDGFVPDSEKVAPTSPSGMIGPGNEKIPKGKVWCPVCEEYHESAHETSEPF